MPTPKQLANLKPARKGEVRNPNGRPPGSKNWASIAREMLEDPEHIIKGLRHNGYKQGYAYYDKAEQNTAYHVHYKNLLVHSKYFLFVHGLPPLWLS